jgi:hypothetical protein
MDDVVDFFCAGDNVSVTFGGRFLFVVDDESCDAARPLDPAGRILVRTDGGMTVLGNAKADLCCCCCAAVMVEDLLDVVVVVVVGKLLADESVGVVVVVDDGN